MIPIRNIYYMLAYAFRVLKEEGYQRLADEEFRNASELFAAILARGVSVQLRRGLGREYLDLTEPLSAPRGKIEISESIKTTNQLRKQLVCSYDDFSVNSYLNRILKTTMVLLLHADMTKERKKELRKLLVYFVEVETLDPYSINWNQRFNRNNQTYRMLVAICRLAIQGLIQSKADGKTRMLDFTDEQMARLYEKFILEYYRKEYPQFKVSSSQIAWGLDDGEDDMLPVMQSDIMIEDGKNVLIIDAKYYSHATQVQYNKRSIHSSNLYQIFTYVKNKEVELAGTEHRVAGMLLYAGTDDDVLPDQTYSMSGNQISVKTLDLNRSFPEIEEQLKGIVKDKIV